MSAPEGFVKVGMLTDLAEHRGRCVRVGDDEVALWRVEGQIFAISNVCPHQHVSGLHMGVLKGLTVACPMHGWTYSLETGAVEEGEGRVKTYRVLVVEDEIYLERPRPSW
jgi:nitrite reductase (NADH) small subunit